MSTGTDPLFIDVTVQRPVLVLSVGLCPFERHGKEVALFSGGVA